MIDRRERLLHTGGYVVLVVVCFLVTWSLWDSRTEAPLLTSCVSLITLFGALLLSNRVPPNRHRPVTTASIAVGAWGLALVHAALTASDSEVLSDVAIFAVVGIAMSLFFGLRIKPFTNTLFRLGALITGVTLIFGITTLASSQAPAGTVSGIGVTTGITTGGSRGLVMRLDVYPTGCSEVVAAVHIFGTSEFWAHQAHRTSAIPLQLVMPSGSAREMQVVAVTDQSAALSDIRPGSYQSAPIPSPSSREQQQTGDGLELAAGLTRVESFGSYEVVDAWVGKDWSKVRTPVAFWFKPSWLAPKGLRSCYVLAPPLVGSSAYPDPDADVWDHITMEGLTFPSSASVTLHGGGYFAGTSQPPPSASSAESLAWECDVDPLGTTPARSIEKVPTYSLDQYREEAQAPDCGSVTPLEEASARTLESVLLLVVGGLISLGLTLMISAIRPSAA